MLPEKIIFIGVLLNLITCAWYIRDITHGSTRPNLISWFIWMLAPFIGAFFEFKAGAGFSALPVFMSGFSPLLVIIFSLLSKNTYWKIIKLDIICGIISFLALVLYVFTHNLGISILFAIVSDGLAAIPTLMKSWKFPETETSVVYLAGVINNILGLLIIKKWIFSIYSFGIYLVLMNITIVFCIYHKKIFRKFKTKICS